MNPKSWLRRFQKTSIWYLIKMAIFYHILSLALTYLGSQLVVRLITDYEEPTFPVSIVMALTAGPIEETLFFGLPYYLTGNTYAVLVLGSIWSIAHIFSTQVFQLNTLGYVNFLATLPHLFFSLRTWISGKGWFAILFHTAWNVAFLFSYCFAGLRDCTLFGEGDYLFVDLFAIGIAVSLILILYLLDTKNKISKTRFRIAIWCSVGAFVVFEVLINLKYVEMFFNF
jgi:hypothetical protein